jgi:sugar phosphate isomerase/epimerase
MMDRRHFIASGTALSAFLANPAWAAKAGTPARGIGLQLYTIADALRADFDGALRAVAAIGYRSVESNLNLAGRDALALKQTFSARGLAWQSAHVMGDELGSGLDKTIETARQAGLEYLVCAFPPVPASFKDAIAGMSLDDWRANADLFNRIGERTRAAGIQFVYHNHNLEFRLYDGVSGYDTLLARTDPSLVKLELDCGWMASAGLDPVAYLGRYPGRYAMLHLKDLRADHIPNTNLEMASTEVGKGIIAWPRLLRAAAKAGIGGFYVEQEPPFAISSLNSVRESFAYLSAIG